MINLLPPKVKTSYGYAYRNARLLRYVTGLSLGLIGIVFVLGAALLFLSQEVDGYKESAAISEASLRKQNEAATISEVSGISDSITLSVDVLSKEILFSELLRQVGSLMPRGTILQGLSISNDLTGALDLEVGATDYTSASQVQVNLQDDTNKIFAIADLNNISCAEGEEVANVQYPCTVNLRALFAENSSFYLISPERESSE